MGGGRSLVRRPGGSSLASLGLGAMTLVLGTNGARVDLGPAPTWQPVPLCPAAGWGVVGGTAAREEESLRVLKHRITPHILLAVWLRSEGSGRFLPEGSQGGGPLSEGKARESCRDAGRTGERRREEARQGVVLECVPGWGGLSNDHSLLTLSPESGAGG